MAKRVRVLSPSGRVVSTPLKDRSEYIYIQKKRAWSKITAENEESLRMGMKVQVARNVFISMMKQPASTTRFLERKRIASYAEPIKVLSSKAKRKPILAPRIENALDTIMRRTQSPRKKVERAMALYLRAKRKAISKGAPVPKFEDYIQT